MYLGASKEQLEATLGWELERMKSMDVYIAVRGSKNVFENSDIPADDIKLANKKHLSQYLTGEFKKQNGASCDGLHHLWHSRQK